MGAKRKNNAEVNLSSEQVRDDITSKIKIQGRGDLIIVCLFAFLDKLTDMYSKEEVLDIIDLYVNKLKSEKAEGELLS